MGEMKTRMNERTAQRIHKLINQSTMKSGKKASNVKEETKNEDQEN